MNRVRDLLSRLPMKWKLTFWSSILLCGLFVVYNSAQYLVITQWMTNQEESRVQASMNQILLFFKEKGPASNADVIRENADFIEKINQPHQFIRILDPAGQPVVTAADDVPLNWVAPKPVNAPERMGVWHLQDHLLISRSPLVSGNFSGTVEIVVDLVTLDRLNDEVLFIYTAAAIGAVLLSGIGGFWIARQLLRPIQTVTETMKKIKSTGLEARVQVTSRGDEISDLAVIFNRMMDELEASFRQQRQFVEDASHELRTPIAIIEGHLSLLQRWGKKDPAILDESLEASLQEMARLKSLVRELLEMTRAESGADPSPIPLVNPMETVQDTLGSFASLHTDFRFDVDISGLEGVQIAVRPQHLAQILLILLDNAVKYAASRKIVEVMAETENNMVYLHVTDYGEGIPSGDIAFVFDRFYRTDKSRSRSQGGSGLGLAIAKRLVENYNGTIAVQCGEKTGTRFTLTFPISSV